MSETNANNPPTPPALASATLLDVLRKYWHDRINRKKNDAIKAAAKGQYNDACKAIIEAEATELCLRDLETESTSNGKVSA